jgi:hypothetical protein
MELMTLDLPTSPRLAPHTDGEVFRFDRGGLSKCGADEVRNLFVPDGSTPSTPGTANPTLTIVAPGLGQASYIQRENGDLKHLVAAKRSATTPTPRRGRISSQTAP